MIIPDLRDYLRLEGVIQHRLIVLILSGAEQPITELHKLLKNSLLRPLRRILPCDRDSSVDNLHDEACIILVTA